MTIRTGGAARGNLVRSRSRRSRMTRLVLLGLAVIAFAGCETGAGTGGVGLAPSASLTTTTPGVTEYRFKVTWSVLPEQTADQKALEGHVENVAGGWGANNVRLLAQSLDSSGTLVGQRLEWLGGSLPPGSRTYFMIRRVAAADQYRVTVWSYQAYRGD